jgi:hypothetical protein
MQQKNAGSFNARPIRRPSLTALCGLVATALVGCGADQVSQPVAESGTFALSRATKPEQGSGGTRTRIPADTEVNQCYVSKFGDGETYQNARISLAVGDRSAKDVGRYFYIRRDRLTGRTTLEANCLITKTEEAFLAAENQFVVGEQKGRVRADRPARLKRASKTKTPGPAVSETFTPGGPADDEPFALDLPFGDVGITMDDLAHAPPPAPATARSIDPPASWECHFEVGDSAFWCGDDICYLDAQESGHYQYSCVGSGDCSWAEEGDYFYDPDSWAIAVSWNSGSVTLREYRESGDPCWVDPPVEDGPTGDGGYTGGMGSYDGPLFSLDAYPTEFLYGESHSFHVSNPASVSRWEFDGVVVESCGTSPWCQFTVTAPGLLKVVATDNTREQEAVINMAPYHGPLEEDENVCGTGGDDEFSMPFDLQESIRDWAHDRFSADGPNAGEIELLASCSIEGCLQGITPEQSKAILDAAKASGEWQYTQGGAQGGVEDAKDRTLKRGDCTDFVWDAVMNALGTTWPNTWGQRLSTAAYRNTTTEGEDLLRRRRLIRIQDGQQRPGDIIVVSGHAAIYTGHVLGIPHGWANNGKPARPNGVAGVDNNTGDHSFNYVSNQYPVYYLRPAMEVACFPSPLIFE